MATGSIVTSRRGLGDALQNAMDMGMGMPKTRGCLKRCVTGFLFGVLPQESSSGLGFSQARAVPPYNNYLRPC